MHVRCKGTWDAFKYNFDRGQYGKPELTERQAPIGAQVGMWWLYFKWQWLRDAHNERGGLQSALAVVFLGLGLIGGWVHYKRDRRSFLFFGPLICTLTLVLIYLPELQVRALAGPGARRHASPAKCAIATTSTCGASAPGACGRRSA